MLSSEFKITPVERRPSDASALYIKILDAFIKSPHRFSMVTVEGKKTSSLIQGLKNEITRPEYKNIMRVFTRAQKVYLEKIIKKTENGDLPIDLSKSGLEFLGEKPYEVAMLRIIWRDGRSYSLNIYNELKEEEWSMDRTTYIKAFKKYEAEAVLIGKPESDAKRARILYRPHPNCPDERAFIAKRLKHVFRRLAEEFPDYMP